MDLRQLRYFIAIVQCGSISRASLQLNIAQPALSLHVRNMEADLGVALLYRTPQGVQPTEAGKILLRNAHLIVDQFEIAQQEIRGSAEEPVGSVRLGLPSTISQMLGVPLIVAARKLYPRINLRVSEAMSGDVLEWLRDGRVDFGLLYRAIDDRRLRSSALLSETLYLIGPRQPPAGLAAPQGTMVTDAVVAGLPFILPGPGHGLRDLLDDQAAKRGWRLSVVIEVDALNAIKSLVEKGLGYAMLPAHAVARERAEGRLRSWAITPPVTRVIHLVHATDRPLSPAVRTIEQLCRTTLADLVAAKTWATGTDGVEPSRETGGVVVADRRGAEVPLRPH